MVLRVCVSVCLYVGVEKELETDRGLSSLGLDHDKFRIIVSTGIVSCAQTNTILI